MTTTQHKAAETEDLRPARNFTVVGAQWVESEPDNPALAVFPGTLRPDQIEGDDAVWGYVRVVKARDAGEAARAAEAEQTAARAEDLAALLAAYPSAA
ncbi:hypothetical protein [Streptomyces albireticuli]|uniref:Uncharacterized protein n=1 Tax=Streptomyces albireticuli TaxID=1940 RepID=A0A2A2D9I5_9ACTN|nr:hypothetical protein [Streptomyces albireticuli]MCD9145902.1 hypothetical protein [Streptomyces albireticuli]MCD9166072.1 hypothetical protein [Streptomyces albireticuli]MCD9196352.1 hypothetical protein [Streptomyces albireticuli]PAU47972.1 hypothetical protein CK936_15800 [Streptomyces albireticuli]